MERFFVLQSCQTSQSCPTTTKIRRSLFYYADTVVFYPTATLPIELLYPVLEIVYT